MTTLEKTLNIPFVVEEGATAPTYATDGAAGMDLRSFEDVELAPMQRKLVRTGLKIAVPEGYEAQVRPRSGLALKHGISMVNSPGTIDSDYRGEIGVILINFGENVVQLARGERIGQLVICPVVRAHVQVVQELDMTQRGEGGFGSTGTK
ncbi:MAG: dUTP diphosphatase [Armatimonadota bacterium]